MADKIFPEGIRVFSPRNGSPDWVKGSIVITPNDLVTWLKANAGLLTEYKGKKQIVLDLLTNKEGKLFLSVNTYKPEDKKEPANDLPF
jgi:hypothetical protein